MALVFMDGFEAGDTTLKWEYVLAGSRSADTRFSTGSSWSLSPLGSNMFKSFTPVSKVIVGFAAKFTSLSGASDFLRLAGDSGATTHLMLRYQGNYLKLVRGDGTVLATEATPSMVLNAWQNYYEISATIADAGGTATVRVNGVPVITYTGDTKNGGTATTIDRLTFVTMTNGGTDASVFLMDDFYICDGTGSAPYNDLLGDVRVHTMVPNGAGTSTQFAPSSGANYTTVDELPFSAADYVRSATPGNRDTYAMSDLPAGVTTIYGVQNNIITKKTDAGTIGIKPVLRSGGTNYYGTTTNLGTADILIRDLRQFDPATSAAWTSAAVNNMESGAEVA